MGISAYSSANSLYTANKALYEQKKKENNEHVRNHEMQHLMAAGQYAVGGIHIDYNSQGWATGGHVNIAMPTLDKSNPQKTINHAKTVQAAALAPSDPSSQDYKVYAEAQKVMFQAQQLLDKKNQAGKAGKSGMSAIA